MEDPKGIAVPAICIFSVVHFLTRVKKDGLVKSSRYGLRIPRNTAIAGANGCVLTVRRNDEGRSVTRISDFLRYRQENEPKEDARIPRILRVAQPGDEAAPRAAMRRSQARSSAHNLAIAARLALPGALPDNTMLVRHHPVYAAGARGNSPAY